ncbi:MAG TPA: DUF6351 family protein [Casimicrobiaceae bacterium]
MQRVSSSTARRFVAVIGIAFVALAGSSVDAKTTHSNPAGHTAIETLSTRADYVSGGDVLVRVALPNNVDPAGVQVIAAGYDVSAAFKPEDHSLVGLVTGLPFGKSTIAVNGGKWGNADASIEVTNYPITGPIFSGNHVQPFICQTQDFLMPDGSTLGPALDADCSIAPRVDYVYRASDNTWKPLADTTSLPADVVYTTTTTGVTVPFVVRLDTRTVNRGIYQSAILFDPTSEPAPSPTDPPKGWNHRLIAIEGFGCPGGWYIQGKAQGSLAPWLLLDPIRLGQGYATWANTLQHPANSCNGQLGAETAMMSKEQFIESYGAPDFTISHGCSGGSYTSTRYTDIVPGLFDGILIACTFPDPLSIALNGLDGHLLTYYFILNYPGMFTDDQIVAVTGFKSVTAFIALANQAQRTDPVPGRADIAGYNSAVWNPAVPMALRYDPVTNPDGARPTVFDWERNVNGVDPATGFALRPYDNVGVQYGLRALNGGEITKEQFLHLNANIGGYDQDANYVALRSVGNLGSIKRLYESGVQMSGAGGLASIPIMDVSGIYNDDSGYHYQVFHFAARARLAEANGNADNYVMWRGSSVPYEEAWDTLIQWVTNYLSDPSNAPQRLKVIRDKPAMAVDGCFAPTGEFVAEPQTLSSQPNSTCNALYPSWELARIVAGGPQSLSIIKCQLKPIDPNDYAVTFTPAEMAQLHAIFPDGVCDWTRKGVNQVPIIPLASEGPAPQNRIDQP